MLRLIDANFDRLGEGLRVLDDVARFLLNDPAITEKLKALRHELVTTSPEFRSRLLASRDSEQDVGRTGTNGGDATREDIIALVTANAKRAQEALRVLEEFAKLPTAPREMTSRNFEQARFTLYEIERELGLRLGRKDKRERIAGLYVIIDAQTLSGGRETEATRQAIKGGAEIIQLRDKHRGHRELLSTAQELKQICTRANVLFIMNDYVDLALATDADGVHLGQGDLPVSAARAILPLDKLIGCSARTVDQALDAQKEGADYIAVGSIYPSPTKPSAEVVGLEGLRQVKNAVSVPVVALGGISENNAAEVIKVGADSVAVISAVLNTEDIVASAGRLVTKMKEGVIIGKA